MGWQGEGLQRGVRAARRPPPRRALPLPRLGRRPAPRHAVRRMMWMPESDETGPLSSPTASANAGASNAACIFPRLFQGSGTRAAVAVAALGGSRGPSPCRGPLDTQRGRGRANSAALALSPQHPPPLTQIPPGRRRAARCCSGSRRSQAPRSGARARQGWGRRPRAGRGTPAFGRCGALAACGQQGAPAARRGRRTAWCARPRRAGQSMAIDRKACSPSPHLDHLQGLLGGARHARLLAMRSTWRRGRPAVSRAGHGPLPHGPACQRPYPAPLPPAALAPAASGLRASAPRATLRAARAPSTRTGCGCGSA
jgi:hypothetical protein